MRGRLDSAFFGENQSRIVVSVQDDSAIQLSKLARRWRVPLTLLGRVAGKRLAVDGYIDMSLTKLGIAWQDGLKMLLSK